MELQIIPITKTEIHTEKYQLDSTKLSQIENSFSIKVQEGEMLLNQYMDIIEKDITPEIVEDAKELAKKLVKVRTGIAAIHKAEKEVYLKAGQYCDALKNKHTLFVEQMEDNLKKIVNYFDDLEKEKAQQKRAERWFELSEFTDSEPPGLDTMTDEMFEIIKAGIIAKSENDKADAALNKIGQDRYFELNNYRDYLKETFTVDQLKVMPESEYLRNLSIAKLEKQNAIDFKEKVDVRAIEIRPYLIYLVDHNLQAILNSSDAEYSKVLADVKKQAQQAEKAANLSTNATVKFLEKVGYVLISNNNNEFRYENKEINDVLRFDKIHNMDDFEVVKSNIITKIQLFKTNAENKMLKDIQDAADAKAKQESDEAAKKEKALKKAGEKVQVKNWLDQINAIDPKDLKSETANEIYLKFQSFKTWANTQIENLK